MYDFFSYVHVCVIPVLLSSKGAKLLSKFHWFGAHFLSHKNFLFVHFLFQSGTSIFCCPFVVVRLLLHSILRLTDGHFIVPPLFSLFRNSISYTSLPLSSFYTLEQYKFVYMKNTSMFLVCITPFGVYIVLIFIFYFIFGLNCANENQWKDSMCTTLSSLEGMIRKYLNIFSSTINVIYKKKKKQLTSKCSKVADYRLNDQ